MKLNKEGYEYASPNAAYLIQSLRAFGYDTSTAIADLIDNSIAAQANNIDIQFEWNSGEPWIGIIDDGVGMNEFELYEAMRLGCKNPLDSRESGDLGRFGLGLKTASFSQCKKLTVISKKQNENICLRCWDLDLVTEYNEWRLLKIGSEIAEELSRKLAKESNTGTIVLLEKLDRIIPGDKIDDEVYQDEFLKYAKKVEEHISTVFSGYMNGKNKVSFKLNNNLIKLWDPFMSNCISTTILPTESLYIGESEVKVKTYILPHISKITPEEYMLASGNRSWFDKQGFYIYRNNRLIVGADWLIDGFEKKEQYRLARIRIDIGNDKDSEWGIDVRKSIAVPPISIKSELKRIALVAQRESAKIYRHRGKKLSRNTKDEKSFFWQQITRHGKLGYRINREHKFVAYLLKSEMGKQVKQLLEVLEETIPVPMIITDYSENSEKMLAPFEGKDTGKYEKVLDELYGLYIENGVKPADAIQTIAACEPFIYMPEQVQLFKEAKGL